MKKLFANIVAICAIVGTSIVAHADEAGWQLKEVNTYTISNFTMTTYPVSLEGGGIKACFYDVDHSYSVQLYEQDSLNSDESIGSVRTLKDLSDQTQCLTWSEVNTESGNEELYLVFNKSNITSDKITIKWYD